MRKPATPSTVTWLSLSERPPPEPVGDDALLCWFLLSDESQVLGRYLGGGECKLITDRRAVQQSLPFDQVTAWRPFNEEDLERMESNA